MTKVLQQALPAVCCRYCSGCRLHCCCSACCRRRHQQLQLLLRPARLPPPHEHCGPRVWTYPCPCTPPQPRGTVVAWVLVSVWGAAAADTPSCCCCCWLSGSGQCQRESFHHSTVSAILPQQQQSRSRRHRWQHCRCRCRCRAVCACCHVCCWWCWGVGGAGPGLLQYCAC